MADTVALDIWETKKAVEQTSNITTVPHTHDKTDEYLGEPWIRRGVMSQTTPI
jgi:hypothetical protein